jgi:hypothetical protein
MKEIRPLETSGHIASKRPEMLSITIVRMLLKAIINLGLYKSVALSDMLSNC